MGLRPLDCWDWGVRKPLGNECLFLMCCVLSGRSVCVGLRSPTKCGVSGSDREASIMRRPWPTRVFVP